MKRLLSVITVLMLLSTVSVFAENRAMTDQEMLDAYFINAKTLGIALSNNNITDPAVVFDVVLFGLGYSDVAHSILYMGLKDFMQVSFVIRDKDLSMQTTMKMIAFESVFAYPGEQPTASQMMDASGARTPLLMGSSRDSAVILSDYYIEYFQMNGDNPGFTVEYVKD